jgi:hypothetical protein
MTSQAKAAAERAWRVRVLRSVHAALGSVLVAAGVLKLAATPGVFTAVVATAEVLGGLWLVVGLHPEQTRPWTVAAFVGLWAASAYQVLAGRCSCGCLGALTVSPWLALAFDLAAVVVLLRCDPEGDRTPIVPWEAPRRALGLGLIALLVGLAGGWQQPVVSLDGTATLGGKPLQSTELQISGESISARVRTDDRGAFRFPGVPPGLYSVTLFDRSTRLNPTDFRQDLRAVSQAMKRLSRKQQQALARARRSTRTTGPTTSGDAVTVWLDLSDCSGPELALEYK